MESKDGIKWSKPVIVLGPNGKTDWESDINRPVVIKNGDLYQMWYTGQARGKSWIGFATSKDGKSWERMSDKPVLAAEKTWEKVAVMCPHVIYDDKAKLYRMWYSGGEQYEPNAIGYATSEDGLKWTRDERNPIFKADPKSVWEKDRVTGCQVIRKRDWHIMFYIGFRDVNYAQIGIARSKDGITDWQPTRPTPSFVRARDSGTKTPCTSRMRSTTAKNGSCGTTVAREASSKSGWPCIQGKTWDFEKTRAGRLNVSANEMMLEFFEGIR